MSRWGPEGPPPEAYSRVTNPERFAPLIPAADVLVAELVAAYDVVASSVDEEGCERAVRLTPRAGAPLTIGVTDFPSLFVRYGQWSPGGAIPPCGCDACDEDAESALAMLRETVDEVVGGYVTETLSADPMRYATAGRTRRGWSALDAAQFAAYAAIAPPGTRRWDPWPRQPD